MRLSRSLSVTVASAPPGCAVLVFKLTSDHPRLDPRAAETRQASAT